MNPAETTQYTKYVHQLLKTMVDAKGSDMFITSGFPPAMKVNGVMTPMTDQN